MSTAGSAHGRQQAVVDRRGGNLAIDLFVVSQHLGGLLTQAFEGIDITPSLYAVYSQLADGPLTPGTLGDQLGLRPTTLSGYLSELQKRGHLRRERSSTDGRSVIVTLTPEGQHHRRAALARLQPALAALHTCLGDQESVATARTALAHIDAAILKATDRP